MTIFTNNTPCSTSFPLVTWLFILPLLVACGSVDSGGASDPPDLSDDDWCFYEPFDDNNNPCTPCQTPISPHTLPIYDRDVTLMQFPQNLEHLECDFFLWGALGYGLDHVAPQLTLGGPRPIGVRKANLGDFEQSIIMEFGLQEVGHLRSLKRTFGGIPRPLMDLSPENFARIVDQAFEHPLYPPFDPYRDSLSFIMASYIVPYVGLTGYVGANPQAQGYVTKKRVAQLLGVESAQDAVIRMYLYERANQTAHPYKFTVGEFTKRISKLRNKLGRCGLKDEGIIVPPELGAEGKICSNVLSANRDSLSYSRTGAEVLKIVYGTGNEHVPGGFFPKGANGELARSYLHQTPN